MAAAVERWARSHRDEMIQDLKGLIAIRSIAQYGENGLPMGTGCKQALSYLEGLAQRYEFSVQNGDDYYLSIRLPGKSGGYELGMLGHADIVPEGSGWKYDPFSPIEKNGYLIGRGAIDNKGPVIMALYAMRALRELGNSLSSNLHLIIGCDEEKEMRDMQYFLLKNQPPAFTLNCDGKWPVCIGEKGILNADVLLPWSGDMLLDIGGGEADNMVPDSAWAFVRKPAEELIHQISTNDPLLSIETREEHCLIHLRGKSAHVSCPGNGDNAIRRLLRVLCNSPVLTDEEKRRLSPLLLAVRDDAGTGLRISHADRLSGAATCVPTQIKIKNGCLCVHLNIRYAVTQNSELLIRHLRSGCERLGLKLENVCDSPPRLDSVLQPEINLLIETCREFVSKRCQPYVAAGGTHSRIFPASIPFGPGMPEWMRRSSFGGPHAADEAVFIDDLILGVKVYAAALIRLDRHHSTISPFV